MDNYQENLVKDEPQIPSQSDSKNAMPHILGKPFQFSWSSKELPWVPLIEGSSLEMAKQFDLRISLLLQHPYMTAGWLLVYGVTIIPRASFIYIIPLNLFGGRETRGRLLQQLTEKLWRLKSWRQMEELLF